ncbi:MAG: hypothetical protein K0A90_08320 [Methanosarcinaceae archaeon]|nr:hypothetical protein [Methanosarcinaceae archaeon]
MSIENRDFVIERLERRLHDKDQEFEELKVTLRDSIMTELRRDLQNDLDINNRLVKIEQKVVELSNTLNGMMDELLDQKSELRSTRNLIGQRNSNDSSIAHREGSTLAVQTPVLKPHTLPNSNPIVQPHIRNTSTQPSATPSMSQPNPVEARKPNKAQFNIREVEREEPKPEIPKTEPKTEYIIAESGNGHPGHITNKDRSSTKSNRSEYIIANDKKDVSRESQSEHGVESIVKRDGEDVEITTTRKRSGF